MATGKRAGTVNSIGAQKARLKEQRYVGEEKRREEKRREEKRREEKRRTDLKVGHYRGWREEGDGVCSGQPLGSFRVFPGGRP
ncbi:MAG TPA: hypothetical protein VNU20_04325 [Candidatus Sulfotelmatobacter sp.]|jgi:hypothetical protein|nr:hypothetical protein [Candidatus Sulfotelmatobacter sp.]